MIINSIAFPDKAGLPGRWIDNPTREQIEEGFSREWVRMGGIAVDRSISTDPKLAEPGDENATQVLLDIGIDGHDHIRDENGDYTERSYAFINRRTINPKGQNGLLIWDPENTSEATIKLEDTGGAIWHLRPRNSVPIPDAIDLVYRFLTEGYIGDDLTWGD